MIFKVGFCSGLVEKNLSVSLFRGCYFLQCLKLDNVVEVEQSLLVSLYCFSMMIGNGILLWNRLSLSLLLNFSHLVDMIFGEGMP